MSASSAATQAAATILLYQSTYVVSSIHELTPAVNDNMTLAHRRVYNICGIAAIGELAPHLDKP